MKAEIRILVKNHGENLLEIFPDAVERDPVTLCKKLRILENQASAICVRLCNGEMRTHDEADKSLEKIMDKVKNLLFGLGPENVPILLNRDPRGYALKIEDAWMYANQQFHLHRDMGGYGILAPEIK